MKTLDEVINIFDKCCNDKTVWFDENTCLNTICTLTDALQYLKAYKDDRNDLSALRAFWAEQQANDPLTWDELKQMEGKPVWVEEPSFFGKRWVIISGMNDEAVFGTSIGSQVFYCKENQGTEWQAYRKERTDDHRRSN